MSNKSILFPSIFGGSLGSIGFYYLFSKLDKINLEVIKAENIESYGKAYFREYEDRELNFEHTFVRHLSDSLSLPPVQTR